MRLDGLSLAYRSPYVCGFLPMFEEMQARLEERRAERKRIAQDLHDTVLQEFLGASLQLQVAVDQLPANSAVKLRLNRVVEMMGRVVEGVRLAVCGLRSSSPEGVDLAEAFARIPNDLGPGDQIAFRVLIVGSPRRLNPVVRDVVYRIGHEALVNAFRHSRATRIEVELQYTATRFRLVVRDDGCGIDPKVLHSGAMDTGDCRVCANERSELEHGSEFGAAVRPEQRLSWRSRRASLSNIKARIVGVSVGRASYQSLHL